MPVSVRARRHIVGLSDAAAGEQLQVVLRAAHPRPISQGLPSYASATARPDRSPGQIRSAGTDRPVSHEAVLAAVEQVRHDGGPIAAAQALTLAHHHLMHPGLGELRHLVAQALIAEGSRTLRHSDTLTGLLWRTVDLILDGDSRAARCLTELRGRLAERDQPTVRFVTHAIEAMFEIRAGRFARAEQRAQQCAALGAAVGDVDAPAWHASHLLAIRWYQGRVAELLPAIREVAGSPDVSPADFSYHSALAVTAATAGNRREAVDALARCDPCLRQAPRSGSWLVAMYGVVEAGYLLGEREIAGQAYRLLLPYASLPAVAGPAVSCFGSVEHALGVARLTLADEQGAARHLQRAVAHNTALGHLPAATLARHRLAAALSYSPDPAHRAQALGEAQTARRDALELGMTLPGLPQRAYSAAAASVAAADPTRPAAATTTPPHPPRCVRYGRQWQIHAAGRTVTVEHCRGMAYLAVLIANPGDEIPALDLSIGPHHTTDTTTQTDAAMSDAPTMQPLLDTQALKHYRQRIETLQQEIQRYEARGDQVKVAHARAEEAWLQAQLSSATGFAGRTRAFPTAEGRARVAVGKAIRRALARITEADAHVGALLSATVRTGRTCTYTPPMSSATGRSLPEA